MGVKAEVTDFGSTITQSKGQQVTFTWTSDAAGNASGTTDETICGLVRTVITDPHNSKVPTDNYKIELREENGADLLGGLGVNRDSVLSESLNLSAPAFVRSPLTLVVSGAGDSKKGTVIVTVSG
jgi:hypothetical protein